MKNITVILWLSTATCFAARAQSFSEKDFKALHALAGTWKMETARGVLYEQWQVQNDHQLNGKSFKINNADTVILERVSLYMEGNTIIYSPVVTNQNNGQAVPFALISNTDQRYTFENKEHDFPQRVIYQLGSGNAIQARIEGAKNGKQMASDFNYTRVQ